MAFPAAISISNIRLQVLVGGKVNGVSATLLLNTIATEKAQQLNSDTLESVCGGVSFGRIENRGTNITAEYVRVLDR